MPDSGKVKLMKPPEKTTLNSRLKTYMVAGLFTTLPLAATALVIWWIDKFLRGFWPEQYRDEFYVSLVSLIFIVLVLLVMGAVSHNILGRQLLRLGDYLVTRIPIVGSVYGTVKQVTEAFNSGRSAFREVLLIRYPHEHSWAIAFLTNDAPRHFSELADDELLAVFMPTTPNPTSGFLMFVPKKDVKRTSLSVDEAFKLIISTGMVLTNEETAERKEEERKKNA